MSNRRQIDCLADRFNYLKLIIGSDFDIALKTERFNVNGQDDYKLMLSNPTMRTSQGGGRYTLLSNGQQDLHTSFFKFFYHFGKAVDPAPSVPSFDLFDQNRADMVTLRSDDGGKEQGFNLYSHDDFIGVQAFEKNKTDGVLVWLGASGADTKDAGLLRDIWQSALATSDHCQKNSSQNFAVYRPKQSL